MTGEKDAREIASRITDAILDLVLVDGENVSASVLHPATDIIAKIIAPILAEKERAEQVLCDLMNAAGHYKATHSEIDREALSATIKAAADHFAAAIRAGIR